MIEKSIFYIKSQQIYYFNFNYFKIMLNLDKVKIAIKNNFQSEFCF